MKQAFQITKYWLLLLGLLFMGCDNGNSEITATPPTQPLNTIGLESVNPYASVDKSPMDMSYYPPNFPSEKMNGSTAENTLIARVIYSRPQKNNRKIFADSLNEKNYIQLYGKEWRLGANEATEIEFFKPVTILGNKVAAGRYIIYCIPYSDKWVIRLNTNLFSWGLHMNTKKDILQVTLPVSKNNDVIESFTMVFIKADKGANLVMAWGNLKVSLPIVF